MSVCLCAIFSLLTEMVVTFIVNYVDFIFWLIIPLLSMSTGSLGKSELLHVICLIIKRSSPLIKIPRSSALPVIQRGCYTHLIGHRKGQPLEINFIKKGSVLHFRVSDHPSLPSSLRGGRPLMALMITNVDEKTKKQLL